MNLKQKAGQAVLIIPVILLCIACFSLGRVIEKKGCEKECSERLKNCVYDAMNQPIKKGN